ncbi:uncharacterized protein LOC102803632 [Saccoglossus kowalevskii]|uniref:Uncharacterized protein LOC102803632 n=1 Tax=Saccoglossus kowalevskii TaxID=10224 RepID=A0ABM0LXR0_SACKO|nr:PREDICTED: uncharacterized protein LOC102803632 [Saccoglossus kowalevskii]
MAALCRSASLQNSPFIIFNFFKKCPPTPGFKTFADEWKAMCSVVFKYSNDILSAQLHENLDSKGKYKIITYHEFSRRGYNSTEDPPLSTPDWGNMLHGAYNVGQEFHKGEYRELSTIHGVQFAPTIPQSDKSVFIIASYRASEEIALKNIEERWQEWSVLRFIDHRAGHDLGMHNLGIYKRFSRTGIFTYIIRGEFTGLNGDITAGWDLVNKVRSARMPHGLVFDDISLYRIRPSNIIQLTDIFI